jgi:hypothetical protein
MKNEKILDLLAHKIDESLFQFGDNITLTIQESSYIFNLLKPSEKPRVSAEEVKQKLQEYIDSRPYYGSCTTEYKEGIEDGAKWMHDYAGQSEENYWEQRCLLAEKCLAESPCDPDITASQIEAHTNYQAFLNREEKQK